MPLHTPNHPGLVSSLAYILCEHHISGSAAGRADQHALGAIIEQAEAGRWAGVTIAGTMQGPHSTHA